MHSIWPVAQATCRSDGHIPAAITPHRCLIIDDDEETRDILRELLAVKGFDVRTAANGFAAFRQLQLEDQAPCLILVDLRMPVMDGWSFIDQLRTLPRCERSRVVLMSAHRVSQRIEGENMLSKPFRLDQLAGFVEAIRGGCRICDDDATVDLKR